MVKEPLLYRVKNRALHKELIDVYTQGRHNVTMIKNFADKETEKISLGLLEKIVTIDLKQDLFRCIVEGTPHLIEHEAAKWLPIDDLRQVNWLPADIEAVEAIEEIGKS